MSPSRTDKLEKRHLSWGSGTESPIGRQNITEVAIKRIIGNVSSGQWLVWGERKSIVQVKCSMQTQVFSSLPPVYALGG